MTACAAAFRVTVPKQDKLVFGLGLTCFLNKTDRFFGMTKLLTGQTYLLNKLAFLTRKVFVHTKRQKSIVKRNNFSEK